MSQYDFVVIGGGMIGASTALGLAQKGYAVALIEKNLPSAYDENDLPDIRVSAISLGSEHILQQLGAWQHISSKRKCVYRRLAVWENEDFQVEFDEKLTGHAHLGHIIENNLIQLGIHQALADYSNVDVISNQLDNLVMNNDVVDITLANGDKIQGAYVIGADGAQSKVRQKLAIGQNGWQYKQHVFAMLIRRQSEQADITWQQFHPSGPTAFLPLNDHYACLIWYLPINKLESLGQLSLEAIKSSVTQAFPPLLGEFEILKTASFPLMRMHASQYVKHRGILIGDAAHVINPLAGQGVNLGFKDVDALLGKINLEGQAEIFKPKGLIEYQKERKRDNLLMMSGMDLLYQTFSNKIPPLKLLRNLALKTVGSSPLIKKQIVQYAMGLK